MSTTTKKWPLRRAVTALQRAESAAEAVQSNLAVAASRISKKQIELAELVRAEAVETYGSVSALARLVAGRLELSFSTVRSGLYDQLRDDVLLTAVEVLADAGRMTGEAG